MVFENDRKSGRTKRATLPDLSIISTCFLILTAFEFKLSYSSQNQFQVRKGCGFARPQSL